MHNGSDLSPVTLAKLEERRLLLEDKAQADELWEKFVDDQLTAKFVVAYVLSVVVACVILWFLPDLYLAARELVFAKTYENEFVTVFTYSIRAIVLIVGIGCIIGIRVLAEVSLRPSFAKKYPEMYRLQELPIE